MIVEPTLILNTAICKNNIRKLKAKADASGVVLRPHFKTHQSADIGSFYREVGVDVATVSSFKMASYFAQHGWKDITVALTATAIHANEINTLASDINLNILLEDVDSIIKLEELLHHPVGVYLKIDVGYHRTGVNAEDLSFVKRILSHLKECKNLIFIGFLTHAGQTYNARTKEEIVSVSKNAMELFLALKVFLKDEFPLMQLSWGDTPSCSVLNDFYGIDELRPGNFVFYDYMQTVIGSCKLTDIAVCLAAPVLAVHKERLEVVVHAGAVHLSKDKVVLQDGSVSFGKVVAMNGLTWDTEVVIGEIVSLSQEHGVIKVDNEMINKLNPGDIIGILPVHSCLTVNLMKKYLTLEGNFLHAMQ